MTRHKPRKPDATPATQTPADRPKGGDGNRSDPSGYAEYGTERDAMGRGRDVPTPRSPVVPKK